MMVQIYGLPPNVKSYDIKTLIKKECNISEIILDHFVDDVNGSKNIKVGLSTDEEGYRVINCLDGFRFSNQFVIKVEQVGKGSTNRYERNQYGTQSYGSQVSEGYGSGQYAPDLRGQTNPPRQYSGQTDKLASGGFGRNQNMPNQRQWNNEPPPQPRPNVYPSQTNRRNRSPEALPTSFLNEMLHNLKNSRPLQGDEPRTSEFRRQSPPRYPNRPVSPARKPRYVPPNERPSSIRQKGQNWGEPPRYDGNIPQKTQQQRFPPAGDNDRFPTYSADNKNLRYLPSQHSDSSQDKYMGNSQQTAKMPAPFQAPESNPPMYSGGYQHNQKGNSSFLTPAPVRQTPWQNDVKNIPDPNKFENNMPMQSGMRSRSPVRNEPSPIHEAGRTSPKRSWAKETRPQTLNRPAPFVWDDPNAQNNPQSVSAWDSGTFQGNPQRFNNAGNLVGSMQGNRQPGQQFASTSKETAVSQISPQRSDFRQSMDIGRSSDSYRPQFESVQSTSRYENRDENTRSAQESSRFGDHSSRQESNRYQYESDDTEKYSGSTWNSDDNRRSSRTDQTCNEKRDKAAEVIVKSLLQKHQHYITQYSNPDRNRVMRELKFELDRLFEDMFGDRDIPYIEIMIKYKAKFGDKDEEVLIENVLSKLADENRSAKRSVQEYTGIPSKAPRYSQESTNAEIFRSSPNVPDWTPREDLMTIEPKCPPPPIIGELPDLETIETQIPTQKNIIFRRVSADSHIISNVRSNTESNFVSNMRSNMGSNTVSNMISYVDTNMMTKTDTLMSSVMSNSNPKIISNILLSSANPNIMSNMISNANPSTMISNLVPTANNNNMVPNMMSNVDTNIISNMMINANPNAVANMMSNAASGIVPNAFSNVMSSTIPNLMSDMVSNVIPTVVSNVPYETSYPDVTETPTGFSLYLCKDNSKAFSVRDVDEIKTFLVSQIMKETETSQGWSPDITFKGLQCPTRYELYTTDDATRKWLHRLDFSEIRFCNVVLINADEPWYERAAIWLPGHSRKNAIDPFDKLKLQNKKLDHVDINKWKLVKKIVTVKGTRLYFDITQAATKALERCNMKLSYELQKVDVFLRRSAVDKDVFDAGIHEKSITDRNELMQAARCTDMPTIKNSSSVVRLTLGDLTFLTPLQAFKIKENVIYHLFRYLQHGGTSSTDFLKYGFISPNFIGILPENEESKRWLLDHRFGQFHTSKIIVLGGGSRKNVKYITMYIKVNTARPKTDRRSILDTIKKSNTGVEGLNFNLWEPKEIIYSDDKKNVKLFIDIDVKSIETLMGMDYRLVYTEHREKQTIYVKYEYSESTFLEMLNKKKSEIDDSSIVDMEFSSDEEEANQD